MRRWAIGVLGTMGAFAVVAGGARAEGPADQQPSKRWVERWPWVWEGPTPEESTLAAVRSDLPSDGVEAKVVAPVAIAVTGKGKGVLTVRTNRGVTTTAPYPGKVMVAPGVALVRVEFAPDDFFETTVVAKAEPLVVKVPEGKSATLVAGDRRIPVSRGIKVVSFADKKGFDFRAQVKACEESGTDCFGPRVRGPITQIVFHTSLTATAAECFQALVGRGLSTHLMIDADGTVYQALDLAMAAYHAGDANQHSVGIDMIGDRDNLLRLPTKAMAAEAKKHPQPAKVVCVSDSVEGTDDDDDVEPPEGKREFAFDPNEGQKDPTLQVAVGEMNLNGANLKAFGFTPRAMRAAEGVVLALVEAMPTIAPRIPSTDNGALIPRVVDEPRNWGVLGHWHTEAQRWDPGPGFDWQWIARGLMVLDAAP